MVLTVIFIICRQLLGALPQTPTEALPLDPAGGTSVPQIPWFCSPYFISKSAVAHNSAGPQASHQLNPALNLYKLNTVYSVFLVSGANFWNSLPPHVTSAPSLVIFRQRLKTSLFHFSYPDSRPSHLISYTAFNCGPCDNFCYLGHTKKS